MSADEEVISTTGGEDARSWVLRLLEQAHHEVDIQSPHLDSQIYDQGEVLAAIRQLVVNAGRRARVRILVGDCAPMVQRGHRLLELSRQLSSYIEIRELAAEDAIDAAALIVVDRAHYLRWESGAGYRGTGRRHARGRAARWHRAFSDCWERAHRPAALRRLHL